MINKGSCATMKKTRNYFRGCLIGGAVGDALGWLVEFNKLEEIKKNYGPKGITGFESCQNSKAEITDDTQMTLFTAEGLLRAEIRGREKGVCHAPSFVYRAYLRWLHTQNPHQQKLEENIAGGWLIGLKELHARRAPGNTCLSALSGGTMGTLEKPVNYSKGCGGVMRAAPVGLFWSKDEAFRVACECAAITHGHPSGYLPAGVLAQIIACIIEGADMETAVFGALEELKYYQGHEETSSIILKAIELAKSNEAPEQAVKLLGEGWVGEEAIAISVYCGLKYSNDFKKAVCVAVNHDGDSDSTWAITGNMLGAYLGVQGIPEEWIEKVELAEVVTQVADDLLARYQDTREWRERYPGY
jgi:ADP-ribosylglycohydrolase